MKKISKLCILSSVAISLSSFAFTLRTQEDKLSYTLGNELGTSFHRHGEKLNPTLVSQGLQDGLAGRKAKLSRAQKQQVMLAYQKQMLAKIHAKMKKQAKSNKQLGQQFLANNAKKPGVHTTQSGLEYKIIKTGHGTKPTATDTVSVDYKGALINGTVFDSSYKRGKPAQFPVNQVIKGWTEALEMMPTGSTWMLYIPSNLAYGSQGMPMANIGPDSALVFKVHLISTKHST